MRQSGMTVRIRLHGLHRLDAVGGAMGVMSTGRVGHLRSLRGIRRRDIVLDLTRKPVSNRKTTQEPNATYKPKSQILMIRCLSSKSIINHQLSIHVSESHLSDFFESFFRASGVIQMLHNLLHLIRKHHSLSATQTKWASPFRWLNL